MKKITAKLSILLCIFSLYAAGAYAAVQLTPVDISDKTTLPQDRANIEIKNAVQRDSKTEDSIIKIKNPTLNDTHITPVNVPLEGVLNQASYKITAVNPKLIPNFSGNFYPGGRGTNQMIIYDSKTGLRTGTNEFGAEAIVVDNTVIQISGAYSVYPQLLIS